MRSPSGIHKLSQGERQQPPSFKRRKTIAPRVETCEAARAGDCKFGESGTDSPVDAVVGIPGLPRLSDSGHCDNYVPCLSEEMPSREHSPEFMWLLPCENSSDDDDDAGLVLVPQSEGRSSTGRPLFSAGFEECAAIIVHNMDTGEFLLIHHDSGTRSLWSKALGRKAGLPPTKPCAVGSSLIDSECCGYAEFMARPGRKQALAVESDRSFDRTEVMAAIAKDGVQILPPLRIRTTAAGSSADRSIWAISLRPETGELILYVKDRFTEESKEEEIDEQEAGDSQDEGPDEVEACVDCGSKVLHFKSVFSRVLEACDAAAELDAKHDLASHFDEYAQRIRQTAGLSKSARGVLESCLAVVRHRNSTFEEACRELDRIVDTPGIPQAILDKLKIEEILKRDGAVVLGLTELVEHLLASAQTGAGESCLAPLAIAGLDAV